MILKKMTKDEAQEFYNRTIAEADRLKEVGENSSLLRNIIRELEFFYGCRGQTIGASV